MGKNKGLGMVSALAVGAGVAALAAGKKYKTTETKKKEEYDALQLKYDIIQTMIDARVHQNMTQKDLFAKTGITQADEEVQR